MQQKKIHILGICGTLMAPYAVYLKRNGWSVTGTDLNVYPPMSDLLEKEKIQIFQGYQAENLEKIGQTPDLVLVGNVIQKTNPEMQAVLEKKWAYTSLPEHLYKTVLHQTKNIVIAGTHGKTTTTSLGAFVFKELGKKPNYFIGGVPHGFDRSFWIEENRVDHPFLLEGDEYDVAFWDKVPKFNYYHPKDVILTSIEFDHADIYQDLDAVLKAFQGLLDRIQKKGTLIYCKDHENVRDLVNKNFESLEKREIQIFSYGKEPEWGVDYVIKNFSTSSEFSQFQVVDQLHHQIFDVKTKMSGVYNALNATSILIQSIHSEKEDPKKVLNILENFQGVKRRQEIRGEVQGRLVIDDFAHHPTAVKETVLGLKQKYKGKKLIVVFEPRSATSRRKVFQKPYEDAFFHADLVFLAKAYNQSGIPEQERLSTEELVHGMQKKGVKAHLFRSVEEGIQQVLQASKPGDVIAVLSNGGFEGFIPKILSS